MTWRSVVYPRLIDLSQGDGLIFVPSSSRRLAHSELGRLLVDTDPPPDRVTFYDLATVGVLVGWEERVDLIFDGVAGSFARFSDGYLCTLDSCETLVREMLLY